MLQTNVTSKKFKKKNSEYTKLYYGLFKITSIGHVILGMYIYECVYVNV